MPSSNTGAAEFFKAFGGLGSALESLRRRAQQEQQTQAAMNARAAHVSAQARNTEIRWYIGYIYRGNAKFFNTIRITDADWRK